MYMLAIGSDHGGYALNEEIKKYLDSKQIAYEDFGTLTGESCDYPDIANAACQAIVSGRCDRGILICGTGMGMSLVANKFDGIYAACVESVYGAKMCRAINNANILTMGGWIIGPEMGVEMVKAFLNTGFTQDLEPWRAEFLTKAFDIVKGMDTK